VRKRKKREKFWIKFPQGRLEEVAFFSPSSSGYVLGVPDSDQHITVVEEGKSISSHRTLQAKGESDHLGRMKLSDLNERFWVDTLKMRKLPKNQLDRTVFYLTKKWHPLLDVPDDVFFEKEETEKEIVSYIDLDEFFKRVSLFLQQLRSRPEEFMGLCPAREILTSRKIVVGLLVDGNGKAVMKIDDALYQMDLSPIIETFFRETNSVPSNPLFNLLQSVGFMAFKSNFLQRLKEKKLVSEGV
jgi:hypothetical protein